MHSRRILEWWLRGVAGVCKRDSLRLAGADKGVPATRNDNCGGIGTGLDGVELRFAGILGMVSRMEDSTESVVTPARSCLWTATLARKLLCVAELF